MPNGGRCRSIPVAGLLAALFPCLLAVAPPAARAGLEEGLAAYRRGDGRAARAELQPPARQGNAEAQYYLGRLHYYPELGLRRDYRAAARWFRLAAGQGHAAAQYKLGGMHFAGRGVRHDDRQAAAWWRRAAEQGHAEAQNNLGALFANGRGVPRDPVLAWALQARAVAGGNELAAENLRAKEAILTPAELDAAKALAGEMEAPGGVATVLDRRLAAPARLGRGK